MVPAKTKVFYDSYRQDVIFQIHRVDDKGSKLAEDQKPEFSFGTRKAHLLYNHMYELFAWMLLMQQDENGGSSSEAHVLQELIKTLRLATQEDPIAAAVKSKST